MTSPMRLALPVPDLGAALTDVGDAYVASLVVQLLIDGKPAMTLSGTAFETIMMATRLRHLAFAPRTRALTAGSMKAPSLATAIERHWSAIESSAEEAGLLETADEIATLCKTAEMVGWNQAN